MVKNQYIYNSSLIYQAEQKTFKTIKSFQVMKKAANACYNYITKNFKFKRILILSGPGNNGGDGIVLAYFFLINNITVDINFPFGNPKTKDSKKALRLILDKNIIKKNFKFNDYDLVIDAIYGIGFKKKISKKNIIFFNKINKLKCKIISIDIPSGVLSDSGQIYNTAIKAHTTLSLQWFKVGQLLLPGKEYCGKNILLNIGLKNINKNCFVKVNNLIKPPSPSSNDHKFSRGVCFIISGENLIGASKLAYFAASQSALRSGAGLCKLLVNEKNINFFKANVLEEMLVIYKNKKDLFSIIENQNCNAAIFGCGIENTLENRKILNFLLQSKLNLVLDATFFSILKNDKSNFIRLLNYRSKKTVLTPHFGEFKRIFNVSNNKLNDCINAAKDSNSIVVYKGSDTVIGSPTGHAFINLYSSPYLATAGSGDVLTGLIGGFLSQNISAINSARLGCFIHSQCGINLGAGLISKI